MKTKTIAQWVLAVTVLVAPGCNISGFPCGLANLSACDPCSQMATGGAGGDGVGGDDGAGGAPDEGAGGSDEGTGGFGVGGAGVGVGAGGADLGAGVGVGTDVAVGVGAGGGPGAHRPPPRARRHRARLGTAVEAFCGNVTPPPALAPLTTDRLRAIATANGIGAGLTGIQFNREVGLAFETWVLFTMGSVDQNGNVVRNNVSFKSPERQNANKSKGGFPASVIPELVTPATSASLGPEGPVVLDESSFYEVKAVTGSLVPSTSQYQILGLIDVASLSPAGVSKVPNHPPAELTFLTTANTSVSQLVLQQASQVHVAIWQAQVFEDVSTGPNNPDLYLLSAQPLNKDEVYGANYQLSAPAGAWPHSPLTTPKMRLTPVQGDPDPPEVD